MSGGRHAAPARYAIAVWLAFLVSGTMIAAGAALILPDWVWLPGLVQAAGIGGAVVGVARHDPGRRGLWILMITGGAGWAVAAAVARGVAASGPEAADLPRQVGQPAWTAVLLLISYAVVAAALVLLTRQPGQRAASAIDVVIVGAALLVVVWTFAIRPILTSPWQLSLGTVLGLGHAAASGVLVVAILRFSAMDRPMAPATALLCAAGITLALADVAVAAPVSGTLAASDLATLTGQLWPIALGAAALHPGSVRLWTAGDWTGPAITQRRFATFVALALVIPATPLAAAVLADHGRASARELVGYAPTTLVAVAVSVLMVVRLGLIARLAERQASDLRRALRRRVTLERELRHRATHDPLTGLANRSVLLDELDRVFSGPDRCGSLAVVNLDGFKDVNDTLGHDSGDQILIEVANRLKTGAPAATLLSRLGGDEFALLWNAQLDAAGEVRSALDALRQGYRAGAAEVHLSGTAGVLDLAATSTPADALRDADLALTAAKELGKNQLMTFDPAMREERVRRAELAAGLRKVLASGGLAVHYQPVVDLFSGHMAAVEALVRWIGEDGKQIPPMRFIPVAEETGMIVEVGRFVLRRACSEARAWHERYAVAVTVNVSAHQLREPDFVESVLDVLTETGLPAQALVLELTETTMITDVEETTALERLRRAGVRIAVDDFGTGYSSLSYLLRLPVDLLKIDRAFTSPLPEPAPHHWAFVRAILDLANSLNLVAIAEGIETDQQAHTLRNLGCPLAQGFLYSRPVPAATITELLAAWNTGPAEHPTRETLATGPQPVGTAQAATAV